VSSLLLKDYSDVPVVGSVCRTPKEATVSAAVEALANKNIVSFYSKSCAKKVEKKVSNIANTPVVSSLSSVIEGGSVVASSSTIEGGSAVASSSTIEGGSSSAKGGSSSTKGGSNTVSLTSSIQTSPICTTGKYLNNHRYLSIYLYVYLSVYLYVYLSISIYVYQTISLSIYMYIYLFIYLILISKSLLCLIKFTNLLSKSNLFD
jgi:hypothetical protein